MNKKICLLLAVAFANLTAQCEIPKELRIGRAGHAFDHLGNIGEQADAAAASGSTIIYATGLGGLGYMGLPSPDKLQKQCEAVAAYNKHARSKGIKLCIGYVCATSIVGLNSFDKDWSDKFRSQFKTPPSEWRQTGRDGNPLASWYGGEYQPACMNNPDWRTYEKFMVRQQLETGHDGIFFDNPTVHSSGCYCKYCMQNFAVALKDQGLLNDIPTDVQKIRDLTEKYPREFMQFRSTIARDFLAYIRKFARTINPNALITCNNSLNSPDVLFSQARGLGYNIYEMSKTEDLVVVEDMSSQPRRIPGSGIIEYGPTYKQLEAISHGKPVIAVTIAQVPGLSNDDLYVTPPHLMRLAMAEAAANNSSYLAWRCWTPNQRERMARIVRPQAELMKKHEDLLNECAQRRDVVIFLPFRRWLDTDQCTPASLAATLTRANIQYGMVCEDDLIATLNALNKRSTLLIEAASLLNPMESASVAKFQKSGGTVVYANNSDWLKQIQATAPSVVLNNATNLRAVVRDQPKRTIVHLYNLNVERVGGYEDKVYPASDVDVTVRVPFRKVKSVTALTADESATSGKLEFTSEPENEMSLVHVNLPKLEIGTILIIEK